jgi:hypothetical protein
MPAEKDEKETRTKVGIGNTEIDRETRSRSDSSYGDRDRDRGRNDRSADDEYDDYGSRARDNARDFGESVRDAGRSVRREGTDIFSGYCDLLGGIFVGIGEAISPRQRNRSTNTACPPISSCSGVASRLANSDIASRFAGSDEPVRSSSSYSSGGGRVSASRTEVRRPR